MLCLVGVPQWAVVGDTFPVGCQHAERIVYPEYFAANPDAQAARYNAEYGVYRPGCGLDAVRLAWGHDAYLYQLRKPPCPSRRCR